MSKINFNLTATIDECARLIANIGDTITPIIISEPGVGKSSILGILKETLGDDYDYIYVDAPVKDIPDIGMSIPNHETRTLEYYVSSLFKLGNGKKKVIMIDEYLKANKLLQIIFTRLILERTVGDVPLPEGSIVFATSNNATDGVGDAMAGHVGNRVCKIQMVKPKVEVWCAWAAKHGIARAIRAWVAMTPKVMASYLDGDQQDNPYIFNPKNAGVQYASPRSLAKASPIVKKKDALGENLMMAALCGTIGEAAARSMAAFISLEGKIMPTADVLKDPEGVKVPDEISVLLMMLMEAIDVVETQDDLSKYMKFVNRIKSGELIQSIFFTMLMRNKPTLGGRNEQIKNWAKDNYMLLSN